MWGDETLCKEEINYDDELSKILKEMPATFNSFEPEKAKAGKEYFFIDDE